MNNLQKIRLEKGMKQDELAAILNVSQGTLSNWETGRHDIDNEKLLIIAKLFDVSADELLGNVIKNIYPITTKRFPLLGEIAAGEPITMNEDFESYVEAGAEVRADFCIRVRGNSMVNARILDGDIVFIHKQSDIANGEIAAVAIDDEATLKRVYKYPDQIVLYAENPEYQPIIVSINDGKNIQILGKAIAFQSIVR